MITPIQDTFLAMSLSTSSDSEPQNSPLHQQVSCTQYPEIDNLFSIPHREQSTIETEETIEASSPEQFMKSRPNFSPHVANSPWDVFQLTEPQQQPLHEMVNESQLYPYHDTSFSRSSHRGGNCHILDANNFEEKFSNISLNYFNHHYLNSNGNCLNNNCPNSNNRGFHPQCNGSVNNCFTNHCPNSNANTYYDQASNSEINMYPNNCTVIDMNNIPCRGTTPNWCDCQSCLKIYSSGKVQNSFLDLDVKSAMFPHEADIFPKREVSFEGQNLSDLCELPHQKDISDDSGVSRSSSISSSVDDHICYTDSNMYQMHTEPDRHYTNDPASDFYNNDVFYTNNDYLDHIQQPNVVYSINGFKDTGYYESPSESASLPNYLLNGNLTETTNGVHRQITDIQHSHSRHGSPLSDEGFFEMAIPEEKLPCFSQLQQLADSDRDSQSNHSVASPTKKKKAVQEMMPQVEKERRKPGRKPGQVSNVLHLWEFIRDLLQSEKRHGIIEWISKQDGVFQVKNSSEVARLWGEKKKNKKKMTYEKLSRSLRYSRLEGYFADLPKDKNYPKKLCFRFGPKSRDWCDKKDIIAPTFSHLTPHIVHMPHHS